MVDAAMTISGHARRLRRLKPPRKKWSLLDALLELEAKKKEAATEPSPPPPTPPPETETKMAPVAETPQPPTEPRWTKTRRPGPHDWLTWDEIMTIPWIEGEDHYAINKADKDA